MLTPTREYVGVNYSVYHWSCSIRYIAGVCGVCEETPGSTDCGYGRQSDDDVPALDGVKTAIGDQATTPIDCSGDVLQQTDDGDVGLYTAPRAPWSILDDQSVQEFSEGRFQS